MTWSLVMEHLFIVLASSLLSICIGLPLGLLAYAVPKARAVILRVVDLLQTVPALALLGIIMVFIGAGKATVITGITLYSLLPIVRNTCLGLQEVPAGIKEAARGMGMSTLYRLLRVEFPLAFPTVFTGIRIAVVNAIGTAVFAAFVGGGGLGGIINRGIRVQDMGLILGATGALMVIAILLDTLLSWVEKQMYTAHRRTLKLGVFTAAILLLFVALLPYGMSRGDDDALILYEGDYSETQIMHHMIKMLVEDQSDLEVVIKDQMSQVNNFKSLIGDDHTCDMMISYDGTLLTTFLHLDPSDVEEGSSIYELANQVAGERHGLRLLKKLGFDNTYAIAVPETVAEEYGLETISDLVPVADQLVFGAEHEFFPQEGTVKFVPFVEFYDLHFKDVVSVDMSLKYAAAEKGSFDVTEVYATDGLNRKAGLKILEDDRHFFPEYNGAYLVREDTLEKFADVIDLEAVLDQLAGKISNDDMMEMTYQVDVMGRTVDEVAEEFLRGLGLLSGADAADTAA
ncbi:MAG: glycine betaine ABC transporter substrate-binding protein [Eubacteriales bacterium]|nr:glycine betaine ABC transporter substrate-binding protein [Eubacteriales bacterium]